MALSVAKSGPFRGLGLRRSGKHAAPKGAVPQRRRTPETERRDGQPYRAMHAASAPRPSDPGQRQVA
jgi:hypothetical protein